MDILTFLAQNVGYGLIFAGLAFLLVVLTVNTVGNLMEERKHKLQVKMQERSAQIETGKLKVEADNADAIVKIETARTARIKADSENTKHNIKFLKELDANKDMAQKMGLLRNVHPELLPTWPPSDEDGKSDDETEPK